MDWDIEPDGGIETAEYGWILHTCLDNLDFTSPKKLELTAEVVAALLFELSKNKLPKAEKGKIAKGNKYISIQKRYYPPNLIFNNKRSLPHVMPGSLLLKKRGKKSSISSFPYFTIPPSPNPTWH